MSEFQLPPIEITVTYGPYTERRIIRPASDAQGSTCMDLLLRVVMAYHAQYDRDEIRFRLKGLKQEEDEMRKREERG